MSPTLSSLIFIVVETRSRFLLPKRLVKVAIWQRECQRRCSFAVASRSCTANSGLVIPTSSEVMGGGCCSTTREHRAHCGLIHQGPPLTKLRKTAEYHPRQW